MNLPTRLPVQAAATNVVRRNRPWTIRNAKNPTPVPVDPQVRLTRRYEVTWIDDDDNVDTFMRVAPAMPIFEGAFSAFAHGALISTSEGPVAVEDLVPGMFIETATGEYEKLRWVGAMTLIAGMETANIQPQQLFRVCADALGLGRPAQDVTFGPAARLLSRDPEVRSALGSEAALAPVSSLEDGVGVIALTPASPVRVYHLAFDGHHVIRACGIEVESFHPGPDAHYSMSQELRAVFVSLFPHMETLQGFGRVLWPRFETQETGEIEIV